VNCRIKEQLASLKVMREELLLECKGSNEQKAALKCTKKVIELKSLNPLVKMDKMHRCESSSILNKKLLSSISGAGELPFPLNKTKTELKPYNIDFPLEKVSKEVELDTVSKKISSAYKRIRELKVKLKWNKGEIIECEQIMSDLVVLLNSLQMQMKELEKEHRIEIKKVYTEVGAKLKSDNRLFSAMFNS